jgi:hypothetical protein
MPISSRCRLVGEESPRKVHPTHAVRPVGCWAPQETLVAVEQSSGRNRLNIHGAIDLETGQTIMKDVLTADACSNRDQHVPANHR